MKGSAPCAFPADLAQGLEGADDGDLGRVLIEGNGYGLRWPTLDVDLAIPDLPAGRVTAENKATAACKNGAKGGWLWSTAKG